jgi:hypothetical protein
MLLDADLSLFLSSIKHTEKGFLPVFSTIGGIAAMPRPQKVCTALGDRI